MKDTILVTGGAGFIGANFIIDWLAAENTSVVNLDKLTYAGNMESLSSISNDPRHIFVKGDINDTDLVTELLHTHKPYAIINFAAESHVDRSIHGPEDFITTNINGAFQLLESARTYWQALTEKEKLKFRFLHVSTDEVYGSLSDDEPPFTEKTSYAPNSPYSASKAASDHLVRAYHHTYGLPTLTTNCSNNYGPFQFPEKLIPLFIYNAVNGKPLPVYGDGLNVRDWLYVGDHCEAIRVVLDKGKAGETYNIGGWNEKSNMEVIKTVCNTLDKLKADSPNCPHESLIEYVKDRPGHDRRYAIDARKVEEELGWKPKETFETGMDKTINWYLDNMEWVEHVISGEYQNWIDKNYDMKVSV